MTATNHSEATGTPANPAGAVREIVPLGMHWPMVDPFLFCAHHLDAYPEGTSELGVEPSRLAGRAIGSDFSATDGWSMYHGSSVPGFPAHPHRGFETITYARQGFIDHADSLGAAARFGRGDVQWLTAGRGIVHAEMFPLVNRGGPNPTQLFQIWLNLPATSKMVEPHFTMLWSEDIPVVRQVGANGAASEVVVIVGAFAGATPPPPPPNSWAADPDNDVGVWHVHLEPGAHWTLPAARGAETVRTLYVFDGDDLTIGSPQGPTAVTPPVGVAVDASATLQLSTAAGAELLVLQGRPVAEPVAQYGPFVMNARHEIEEAFADYRRTGFGGWPWGTEGPVHGPAATGRFARHANGRTEERDAPASPPAGPPADN
jgi:redox-sensitive bicupin YhaK (pirin superfamily)